MNDILQLIIIMPFGLAFIGLMMGAVYAIYKEINPSSNEEIK